MGDPYSPPCKDRISVAEITNAVIQAMGPYLMQRATLANQNEPIATQLRSN
jgi:hypothetical protein